MSPCCRVRYRDPLATMGALGRECLPLSLPLLTSLLEGRTARLHSHIQRSVGQGNRWAVTTADKGFFIKIYILPIKYIRIY